MPYISPRGTVTSTIPIRPRPRPIPSAPAKSETPEKHIPSADLGEVNSRDRDPFLAQKLDHWKGWEANHEVPEDKKEDVDPLDEEVKEKIAEKAATKDRPQKQRKLPMRIEMPLRIVTEPSKRAVGVNEIEVDERFISDDLL